MFFFKWCILGRISHGHRRPYVRTKCQLWDLNSRPLVSEAWPLITVPSVRTPVNGQFPPGQFPTRTIPHRQFPTHNSY